MRRSNLPPGLPPAFLVCEADAAGVPRGRLRAHDLDSPFHGTRARGPLDDVDRLRLLLRALPPHAFLCGPTAARMLGAPLPRSTEASAFTRPQVGVPLPHNRIRRPGIVGRALRVDDSDLLTRDDVTLTTPERTWIDLAAQLRLPALVAVTDFLICHRNPLTSVARLTAAHARAGRNRGARTRLLALDLCDDRAESPKESEVRVLLVLAGLDAPECNVEIYDGRRFVARVDMLYRDARLIIEYDGDHHRDPLQWSRDQSRRAELESLGYRYTTVTARDFDDPAALVRRIRRLLAA